MLATTLRYPYEVRQDAEYFEGITDMKLPAAMLDIAQEIIGRMSGHFEPDKFTDRYEEAVTAMLQRQAGGPGFRRCPRRTEPANVVNIMDALKRSLEAAGGGPGASRRPRAPSKKPAEAPAPRPRRKKPKARKVAAR